MRKVFGRKACKVPIDAGFTCPNRDGTKGVGGCTFCSEKGSGDFAAGRRYKITEQIDRGIEMMERKWQGAVMIPYFQSYTNTYAPLNVLKERYEEALSHPRCTGICIATRPDSITDEVAEYLHFLANKHFLMLELGLQSTCDKVARAFNRGYTFEEFLSGYEKVKDLFVCIHLINGLPGESREGMIENARVIATLRPSAVKIHLLHVIKGTKLCELYEKEKFRTMTQEEYVNTVCDQIELLPKETVIERVTGDGADEMLVAPMWSKKKLVVQNDIDRELFRRGTYQGFRFSEDSLRG